MLDLAVAAPLPLPALHATHAGIWIAWAVRCGSFRGEAIARLADTPHIILNAPLVGQRLGYPDVSGLDLLELFAFIHPARFAVPTVSGLARAASIDLPADDTHAAGTGPIDALLDQVGGPRLARARGAWTSNRVPPGWTLARRRLASGSPGQSEENACSSAGSGNGKSRETGPGPRPFPSARRRKRSWRS
jgi:ATP-dependent DNA helicase DinG